jgi:tetratricopeptide (TPR) repeat protein
MKRLGMWIMLCAAVVLAQSPSPVDKLIADGKFQEAYDAGIKQGNPAGFIDAAQAASFYAAYQARDNEKAEWFGKAEAAAKRAIQADPQNPDAYFELARAQGRLAQYRGILESLGLASSIKDALDKTLKLNPKHAGAKVALALWHQSLVSKGVGWLYGANGGLVVPLFQEAIALEPGTIIHKVEYAGVLAQMGKKDEARAQYQAALALAPKTAADRYDLERAKRELDALK